MKKIDPEVEDHLINARGEMKRVDHLVYVSLKYTRTVDVLRNVVKRIIESFDHLILAILTDLKVKKKIDEIPSSPGMKVELIQKEVDDELIEETFDFYMLLRKLLKCDYERREEYRRHVTMISHVDGAVIEITIDKVEEHYKKTKEFINYVSNLISGKKDD